MRSGKQGDALAKWCLGVLSAVTVAALLGLARTVVSHEVALAVLRENCGKGSRRTAAAATSPPTIWSAFGLMPVPPRLEARERNP
jgi:hypothetical protein